jgi:hypothetical protein
VFTPQDDGHPAGKGTKLANAQRAPLGGQDLQTIMAQRPLPDLIMSQTRAVPQEAKLLLPKHSIVNFMNGVHIESEVYAQVGRKFRIGTG